MAGIITRPMKDFHGPGAMRFHRARNPKPPEFNLIHKWNLSIEEANSLDIYEVAKYSLDYLNYQLALHNGMIWYKGDTFIPIYQNCARINLVDSSYYISFRKNKNISVCIVQPVRLGLT